jgi:hypothetical protein
MLLLVLLAAADASSGATAGPPPRIEIAAQATATVRIVSGERVSPGSVPQVATVSDRKMRGADGIEKLVRLVEFP